MSGKNTPVTLLGDPIWEAFDVSYPYFESLAETVTTFEEDIPSDVQDRFSVVGSLVRHSYFEYDFCDVASERALFTFEMALKARLNESGYSIGDRESLHSLIQEGARRLFFENGEEAAQPMRRLRNMAAHPDSSRRGGNVALSLTRRLARMVDEMYADRTLREERASESEALQSALDDILADGAILDGIADNEKDPMRFLLHDARALLVDNRKGPTVYYVAACPIFDPNPTYDADESINVPNPILLEATDWDITDDAVTFIDVHGRPVEIRKIGKPENKQRYQEKWVNPLDNSDRAEVSILDPLIGRMKRALWMRDPVPQSTLTSDARPKD